MNRNEITGITISEIERARTVKAMETLARCINDENILDSWLMYGVADGDISNDTTIAEIVGMGYANEKAFSELVECFLRCMSRVRESGGLYCGKVCAGEEKKI